MATLLQLRDQIIIDTGILGNPDFSVARLNRMINLAQRYVQSQLHALGMKKWEKMYPLTLSSSNFSGNSVKVASVTTNLPDMLESPKSIIFIATSDATSTYYGNAFEVSVKEFKEQLGNSYLAPTLVKPIFTRLAGFIYLSPDTITDASALYYRVVTDLSTDASSTEIPSEFEEFIIKKVSLEIDSILGKIQEKQVAEQQLDKEIITSYQNFLNKQAETERLKLNHTVVQ